MNFFNEKNIILLLFLSAFASVFFWLFHNPVKDFRMSAPGMDNRPDSSALEQEIVKIGENFEKYLEFHSDFHGKWTRFRGQDFDNQNKENIKLIDKFPETGAKILWKHSLGEGHSAPVIYNGKVYILDYEESKKSDALRCFSLIDGKEIWKRSYKNHVKRNHGMSRTTPAITDSFIVTLGPKGHAMCSNLNTGKLLWGIDLVKEYKSEIPFWYTGQCPMIDENVAIFAPAGTSLLIGIDCKTGKVIWQTPNAENWKMSHSSIMPMTFNGKKMYVYAAIGGITGVSAEKENMGEILWTLKDFAPSVVAPSPLILDNGKIFMTAGYGAGSILFQLKPKNNKFEVSILQQFKPKAGLASEQQTPLFYNGHIFGILPKDAGELRNQFVCCKPTDVKKLLWTSGKEFRFGLGPYLIADDKFFILNDDGTLTIAKLSTNKFEVLDQLQVLEGHDAWAPLALADGKLVLRDSKTMICIDIQKK
jgi:outer membrane protein assembly factor BamB